MLRLHRLNTRMTRQPLFDIDKISREIKILHGDSKRVSWNPCDGFTFDLIIPPTVYPPREDTDLLAKRIISLGNGSGKKFLEIGCGSGALSILASSLGWDVFSCDINPYAVAATYGNLRTNKLTGLVKEGGIGPEKFPFEGHYDLIIWNLPYISDSDVSEVLGPMEEAGLVDTGEKRLCERTLTKAVKANLLSKEGRILLLSKNPKLKSDNLASRVWDELEFDDGEKIYISCHWHPFSNSPNLFLETTKSTNDDLEKFESVGAHVYTSNQTMGRGRRSRSWDSGLGSYAGSWIVHNGDNVNAGLLSLAGGLAVLNSINSERVRLKWPNDLYIDNRKLCGILVEGCSKSEKTKAVMGIGINLTTKTIQNPGYAYLEEIQDIGLQEMDKILNTEVSSLLEVSDALPPVNFEVIRKLVLEKMRHFGVPRYKGKTFEDFTLNSNGELIIGPYTINDGDDVEWVQSSRMASSGSDS